MKNNKGIVYPAAVRLRERLVPNSSGSIPLLAPGPVLEGEADADPELPLAVVLNGEYKDGEGKSRVGIVFRDDWRDLPADNADAHLNVTTNITLLSFQISTSSTLGIL